MSRFNTRSARPQPAVVRASSPLRTTQGPANSRTFEGGNAWVKDFRTDLFIRASASFADGSGAFYEEGAVRDEILVKLARQAAVEDFAWFADFVKWLRRTANIRTAALIGACEGVKARLEAGLVAVGDISSRSVIDSVLYRADEPGELLAYWMSRYGRAVPKPVKRGVADAVRRMYNERSLLKYDTSSHGVRFGDVLNLVHAKPDPAKPWQGDLFQYALDRRHHPETAEIPPPLKVITRNKVLRTTDDPGMWLDADFLQNAGMTWEDALSAVGGRGDISKRKVWEAIIPSMNYMALLRNLRNFDEAGVSDAVANQVIAKLRDPEEVAKSRQLPFRFYTAFLNAPSLRWAYPLEAALNLCLKNIPELPGRSLVLIDTSASMTSKLSAKSTMSCVQAAALFGAAVALKNPGSTDLCHFASDVALISVPRGGSVLKLTHDIQGMVGQVGHGTEMHKAITRTYQGHDRVFMFSDMQVFGGYRGDVASAVPAHVPVYGFELGGYSATPMPTGESARFTLGGLGDQTFKLVPVLEAGKSAVWPWAMEDVRG